MRFINKKVSTRGRYSGRPAQPANFQPEPGWAWRNRWHPARVRCPQPENWAPGRPTRMPTPGFNDMFHLYFDIFGLRNWYWASFTGTLRLLGYRLYNCDVNYINSKNSCLDKQVRCDFSQKFLAKKSEKAILEAKPWRPLQIFQNRMTSGLGLGIFEDENSPVQWMSIRDFFRGMGYPGYHTPPKICLCFHGLN